MYRSLIYNPQGQKPMLYGDWLKEQEQDRKMHYAILASFCGGPASEIDEAETLDDLAEKLAKYQTTYNVAWRVWYKAVSRKA